MSKYPCLSNNWRCCLGEVPLGTINLFGHSWSTRPLKAVTHLRASWRCQFIALATQNPGNSASPSALCCSSRLSLPSPRALLRNGSGKSTDSGELDLELEVSVSVSGSNTSLNSPVARRSGGTSGRLDASIWEVGSRGVISHHTTVHPRSINYQTGRLKHGHWRGCGSSEH